MDDEYSNDKNSHKTLPLPLLSLQGSKSSRKKNSEKSEKGRKVWGQTEFGEDFLGFGRASIKSLPSKNGNGEAEEAEEIERNPTIDRISHQIAPSEMEKKKIPYFQHSSSRLKEKEQELNEKHKESLVSELKQEILHKNGQNEEPTSSVNTDRKQPTSSRRTEQEEDEEKKDSGRNYPIFNHFDILTKIKAMTELEEKKNLKKKKKNLSEKERKRKKEENLMKLEELNRIRERVNKLENSLVRPHQNGEHTTERRKTEDQS